ncbi:MAG TPA: sigma-70 family RNA polymerase sigma factor [Solirubrobacteraceae bacterium]|nr:sigma-70 family RNA polymerase sigma factor [Solirubrobacteraceae bacterium]
MEVSALKTTVPASALRGPSPLLKLQSDERLIALTRRGQHAAFEALFSRYQSRLLSFCRHMLNSREDAEDVLQEVFAAAFNAVLADERAINVRPWLYRIARNRSLNHLRRASAIGVDSMDTHFADHGLSTSDQVMRRESFRQLIADVHLLPETQRTALLLREIDALSYDQIAHAMETTVPSVKSLLVRARISLAEAAEARKMSCDEVRLELGEAAEGISKLSTPARRHVRSCQRCTAFKKHLRENNHALAVMLPVAPLLLVKKVLLAKLGTTASAGGAHVAGGAGATAGAGAAATAGAAGGGAGFAGGALTAGAGALATKAAAGLAAAALVTAGAVAADHAVVPTHPRHAHHALTASTARAILHEPVVVHEVAQPVTPSESLPPQSPAGRPRRHRAATAVKPAAATAPVTDTTPAAAPVAEPVTPAAQPGATAPASTQVTEVTSQTTQLPPQATSVTTPTTTTTPATTTPTTTTTAPLPTAEPVPVAETHPASTTPTPPGAAGEGSAAASGEPAR